MPRLGTPSFPVGKILTNETHGTLTILEVFGDTESGYPAYLTRFLDADDQTADLLLREVDVHAFLRGDGRPPGAPAPEAP